MSYADGKCRNWARQKPADKQANMAILWLPTCNRYFRLPVNNPVCVRTRRCGYC